MRALKLVPLALLAMHGAAPLAADAPFPKSPDIIDVLAKGGSEPVGNSSKEATEFLKTEIARWGKVIKQAMVTVQ